MSELRFPATIIAGWNSAISPSGVCGGTRSKTDQEAAGQIVGVVACSRYGLVTVARPTPDLRAMVLRAGRSLRNLGVEHPNLSGDSHKT